MTSRVGVFALVALVISTSFTQALQSPLDALYEARQQRSLQHKLSQPMGITGFSLIDAATDTKVADLVNGTVVDLSSFPDMTSPSFNINASYFGDAIRSVKFEHNGSPNAHTENNAWYSLCGNRANDFLNCSSLGVGNHTVTATPFAKRFSKGDAGVPFTVSFSIVSSDQAPSPVAVLAPTPSVPTNKAPTGQNDDPQSPSAAMSPAPIKDFHGNDTYIKPELLDLKLSLSKVDVTSGPATLEVQVLLLDVDGSYISALTVVASAPLTTHQAGGYCGFPQQAVDGTFECNTTLEFAQFIPDGNYSLELFVYGPDYVITSEELEDLAMPHVVEVTNRNADSVPPLLLDFDAVSSTTVNVTTNGVSVEFIIVAQDNLAGISYGYVEAWDTWDAEGFVAVQEYFDVTDKNSTAGEPFTFNVSMYWSNYNRPGIYLLRVVVVDKAGNMVEFDAAALEQRSFPSSIEIINSLFDDTPPVLLDFAILSPTSVDVTLKPQTIDVNVLVQDGISGVLSVFLEATSEANNDIYKSIQTYFSLDEPAVGEAVSIDLTLTFPRYIRSGLYKLALQVTDSRGNTFSSSDDESNRYVIDVINELEDSTPPQLVDLVALTPTVVNVSSAIKAVDLQMIVQDDVAWVKDFYISAYNEIDGSGLSLYPQKSSYMKFPSDGQPMTFNVSFVAKQSTKPGKYVLHVGFWDSASNYAYFNSEQLAEMNMVHFIEVVNPEYDGEPSVLVDFVLLSSSVVNVTLEPGVVEMQLVVQDKFSGFMRGSVEMWSVHSSTQPLASTATYMGKTMADRIATFKAGAIKPSAPGLPDSSFATTSPLGLTPGAKTPNLELSGDSEQYYYGHNVFRATFSAVEQLVGQSIAYNVSMFIPRYVEPGLYGLQIILDDFAENVAYLGESELSIRSLPYRIQIDNLIVDDEPPQLMDFIALTALELDATSGPVTAEFQVAAQDALSGVNFVYVAVAGPESSYDYYDYSETTFDEPIAGTPVVFNVSFTFEPRHPKGRYSIEVGIVDRANGFIQLMAKDMMSLGFPAAIVVT